MTQLDYSIVVTCFNEEQGVAPFHAALSEVLDTLPQAIEVVYVNDGSADGTIEQLRKIFDTDTRVTTVVDLAMNAGQNNAQTVGIQHGAGRNYIFMDCDLQVDPSELAPLLAKFEEGYEMVGGARARRHDGVFRRTISLVGNRIVNAITGLRLRDLGCNLKVIDGTLLRSFDIGPYQPMDPGTMILSLRRVAEVTVKHRPRTHGRTRWTFTRFFQLYRNVLMNLVPVMYPFILLFLVIAFALLFLYLLAATLAPEYFAFVRSPTFAPLLITLQMIMNFGFFLVIGETVLQSRARKGPAYVVRQVWRRPWRELT